MGHDLAGYAKSASQFQRDIAQDRKSLLSNIKQDVSIKWGIQEATFKMLPVRVAVSNGLQTGSEVLTDI